MTGSRNDLLDLPSELLLEITSYFDQVKTLTRLSRTNKFLSHSVSNFTISSPFKLLSNLTVYDSVLFIKKLIEKNPTYYNVIEYFAINVKNNATAMTFLKLFTRLPATMQTNLIQIHFSPDSEKYIKLKELSANLDNHASIVLYALITHDRGWFNWDIIQKSLDTLNEPYFDRIKKGLQLTKAIYDNATRDNLLEQLPKRYPPGCQFTYQPGAYINLKLIDFSGLNFAGLDLLGMNLSHVTLKNNQFKRTGGENGELLLEGVNFVGAQIKDSNLEICDFYENNFSDVAFNSCTFNRVKFSNVKLENTKFHDLNFGSIEFSDLDLSKTYFFNLFHRQNLNISFNNVTGVKMSSMCFNEDTLSGDLSGADLSHCLFHLVHLPHVKLSKVNLVSSKFSEMDFANVDFYDADLTNVTFYKCDLSNALNFSYARNIEKVSFIETTLNCDWRDIEFGEEARFNKVTFLYANFFNVNVASKHLSNAKFNNAKISHSNFYNTVCMNLAFTGHIEHSNFSHTCLKYSVFPFSRMDTVDFTNANLSDTTFANFEIKNCNFFCADLRRAQFSGRKLLKGLYFDGKLVDAEGYTPISDSISKEIDMFDKKLVLIELPFEGVNFQGARFLTDEALADPVKLVEALDQFAQYLIRDEKSRTSLQSAVMHNIVNWFMNADILEVAYNHRYFSTHHQSHLLSQVASFFFATRDETWCQRQIHNAMDRAAPVKARIDKLSV